MRKNYEQKYTIETLCARVGARLGPALAEELRVLQHRAPRGVTWILSTSSCETPPFQVDEYEATVDVDVAEDLGGVHILEWEEAAEWLAGELRGEGARDTAASASAPDLLPA